MSFFLVRLEPDSSGGMTDVPLPDYGPYDKGSEAAKMAKVLTDKFGFKVQPRRVHQAPDWRARQAKRLASGELSALPAEWDLLPIEDHFAHLAKSDETKIAFTESDELGAIDRVTVVSPGRYLTRFYPEIDDQYRRRLIAAVDPSGEVKYATSVEDITWVYREGPTSCMDNQKGRGFDAYPMWPTGPYAAGDLAIAYQLNNRGRIQSRCLCWPEKKLFGRVFGDFERMRAAMESEGYTWIRDDNKVEGNNKVGSFVGARMLKVPMDLAGEYVLPYFDDIVCVIDHGDYFITADAAPKGAPGVRYACSGGTDGKTDLLRWCQKVESFERDAGFAFVHRINEEWSRPALNSHAFRCDATGQYWPIEDRVYVRENGYVRSWNPVHFALHGEQCQHSGDHFSKKEMVSLSDGRRVHKDYTSNVNGEIVLSDGSNESVMPDYHELFPATLLHKRGDDWLDPAMTQRLIGIDLATDVSVSVTLNVSNNLPDAANDSSLRQEMMERLQDHVDQVMLTGFGRTTFRAA